MTKDEIKAAAEQCISMPDNSSVSFDVDKFIGLTGQRSSAGSVELTEKYGVFKAKDGWRYRHYGREHEEGRSAGPYPTQIAAMKALLRVVGFDVEDDKS